MNTHETHDEDFPETERTPARQLLQLMREVRALTRVAVAELREQGADAAGAGAGEPADAERDPRESRRTRRNEVRSAIEARISSAVSDEELDRAVEVLSRVKEELGGDDKLPPRTGARGRGRRFGAGGFGSGFGSGFGGGFGPRFDPSFGRGEDPRAWHDHHDPHDWSRRSRGRDQHDHPGPARGRGGQRFARIAQGAFERGFEAGFTHGRSDEQAAPTPAE